MGRAGLQVRPHTGAPLRHAEHRLAQGGDVFCKSKRPEFRIELLDAPLLVDIGGGLETAGRGRVSRSGSALSSMARACWSLTV
jgi:hypothetical protein